MSHINFVAPGAILAIGLAVCACDAGGLATADAQIAGEDAGAPFTDTSAQGPNQQPDGHIGGDAGRSGSDARAQRGDAEDWSPDPNFAVTVKRLPVIQRGQLVGGMNTGCSNQISSASGRWCAFSVARELGQTDLWVINLSAVANGSQVQCTGIDANCRRLTTNLWTATPNVGPRHPTAHEFHGDTLIFHANALSASTELYRGPIYAWRPEWPTARQISTDQGVLCTGHTSAQVAVCLDSIEPDETRAMEFDLLAGPLPQAEGAPVLPRIDRIHALRANDVSKWRSGFSRDGSRFCYSTGRTPTDAESLWCFASTELAAKAVSSGRRTETPLATDASRWRFSQDGQKIYFLAGFNYSSDGSPRGDLTMLDYLGAEPSRILSNNVGAFFTLLGQGTDNDLGIGVFNDVQSDRGSLRLIRDRNAPDDYVTIAHGVASAQISPDLRYTYFSTNQSATTELSDAHIALNETATKTATASRCTLQATYTTASYGPPFLANSGLVFWLDEVDPNTLTGTGMVANPADCSNKQVFANKLDYWFVAGDRGIIFSDEVDIDNASLRYVVLTDGKTWPSGGAGLPFQTQASRTYSLTLPRYDNIIFQMDRGGANDGIYYAKLPF